MTAGKSAGRYLRVGMVLKCVRMTPPPEPSESRLAGQESVTDVKSVCVGRSIPGVLLAGPLVGSQWIAGQGPLARRTPALIAVSNSRSSLNLLGRVYVFVGPGLREIDRLALDV